MQKLVVIFQQNISVSPIISGIELNHKITLNMCISVTLKYNDRDAISLKLAEVFGSHTKHVVMLPEDR
jgi:hypothetical protein